MNDGGLSAILLQNLPVLVVVLPLLLAVVAAVIPAPRAAWGISVVGIGGSFLVAILLQSITESVGRITYHLGNWEPPWGIEFVVDSATSLTLVIMTGLAFFATLYARASLMAEIKSADLGKCYAAWLLASGGLFGLVATGDAFNLFVFLEFRRCHR